MPPEVVQSSESITSVKADVVIVGATATDDGAKLTGRGPDIDRSLDGELSQFLADSNFKAKVGDVVVVPAGMNLSAGQIAVVGLGRGPGTIEVMRAAGSAARRLADNTVIASTLHHGMEPGSARAATEGFLLGGYRFTKYRSEPNPIKTERIEILGEVDQGMLGEAKTIAEATMLARDLVNEPAVTLTPDDFANRARDMAAEKDLECYIIGDAELEERGFGGILGVARGSVQPPRMIELRYAPPGARGRVALVGKGITFDSGGLSLKDAKNMETMKTDMSGGAAVVGAMSALSALQVSVEVLAYIPATENMPGGNAIKPGDTIQHYGGRYSEVLNTDAEGRLVLADSLALASQQAPDAIVDVATLTGAIMVALGKKATGCFSNDDDLARELETAAASTGERIWRMPLYDDYRSDIDSEIADIKNTGTRWGGAIYGALFLRDFVGKDIPWAHLDIAGPARADSDYDEVTRGGTGVATRTLLAWLLGRSS